MIARHGTRDAATRSINSRTPSEPYWASCIPSTTRSKSPGLTASGVLAERSPSRPLEETSTGVSRPRMGKRTTVPSRLIKSAVGRVQTRVTGWPASNNLVPNKDPYEAPRISTLYFIV